MTNPSFVQLIGGVDGNGKVRAIAVDENGSFYSSTPPISTENGSTVVVDGIGNKTDSPAGIDAGVASLVSLLKSVVNSTILSGDIAESITIADCLNLIIGKVNFNTDKVTELSDTLEEVRTILINQEDALLQTKTAPINTSGSGDKLIIPGASGADSGKQIKIYSITFISSDIATIAFKFGSESVTGQMKLVSFSSDYPRPMALPVDTGFIINVVENTSLDGYVIWGY